jgi:chromosome segregation ATPase
VAETVLNPQAQKLDSSTDGKQQKNRLKMILGVILSLVMVALTVYVLSLQSQNYNILSRTTDLFDTSSVHQASNYRSYVKQYKDTKVQLEETTRKLEVVKNQLDLVSAELATTKGMLSETQGMLASAQAENNRLKEEIQGLDTLRSTENVQNIPELEAKISTLKQKNVEVSSELNRLKKELRAFEADFANLDEGKSLITLFQSKIKLVASRMRYLKQEAYFAKVAAQKERDRIETLNGNSGFLVKGGEAHKTGTAKGFAIDVKIVQ